MGSERMRLLIRLSTKWVLNMYGPRADKMITSFAWFVNRQKIGGRVPKSGEFYQSQERERPVGVSLTLLALIELAPSLKYTRPFEMRCALPSDRLYFFVTVPPR